MSIAAPEQLSSNPVRRIPADVYTERIAAPAPLPVWADGLQRRPLLRDPLPILLRAC